jgi:hypothetical protein
MGRFGWEGLQMASRLLVLVLFLMSAGLRTELSELRVKLRNCDGNLAECNYFGIFRRERRPVQIAIIHLNQLSLCFSSNASIAPIALSYVHMVTALAGAALSRLTVKPRYMPRCPSCFHICTIVLITPVYVGMFR